MNNHFDNDYSNVKWRIDAKLNEIAVIHTFAINPKHTGKGHARKIFNEIQDIAQNSGQKTLRIDIIDGNIGAQKVFEKLGFEYINSIEIAHYAVGLAKFHIYEYVLKKRIGVKLL